MTALDRFDPFERRITDAIDEIAEARTPAYLDDVLRLTGRTTQRHSWTFPERLFNVNGFRFATAGVVAVLAAAVLVSVALLGGGGPKPSPTTLAATPSPIASAAAAAIDADLQADWLGPHRDLNALDAAAGAHLQVTQSGLVVTQSNNQNRPLLSTAAAMTAAGKLQLTGQGTGAAASCSTDSVGSYDTSLSASKETLVITAVSDPCADRSNAIAGTWWRDDCLAPPCYGNIDPGTYGTEYFFPGMQAQSDWRLVYGAMSFTTTTPWTVEADTPTHVILVPASEASKWTADGGPEQATEIFVFEQPRVIKDPATCPDTPQVDESAGRSVSDLLTALRSIPSLDVASADPITIDGHVGRVVDLSWTPSATVSCWGSGPAEEFLVTPFATDFAWYTLGISGTQRARLILLDLAPDSVLGISIEASASGWDAMLAEATPIVESMTFK